MPLVFSLEAERLIESVKDRTLDAESDRKRCKNIKEEVSGQMKRCHREVLEIVKILHKRLRIARSGEKRNAEAIAQLKAENCQIVDANRSLTEEVAPQEGIEVLGYAS
ncbi:hypothetical protein M0804_013168 [Polistes exclamans]|nr:hypothetical protein M0804_013168 [Polistes exclamans]